MKRTGSRPKPNGKTSRRRPDYATLGGLLVAVGGLFGGFLLEQGTYQEILRVSPFLIVLGGTLGAVLASFPLKQVAAAVGRLPDLFFPREETPPLAALMSEILTYSRQARQGGLLALEDALDNVSDPFLAKGLELAVDGAESTEIRRVMELQSQLDRESWEEEARVFESAAGYAPTIGIVGAVLGLILVMKHIDVTERIGPGIAVAFTATIYGVAFANLFFLPFAKKLRARARLQAKRHEFLLQGICAIAEGLHPRISQRILEAFFTRDVAQLASSTAAASLGQPAGETVR